MARLLTAGHAGRSDDEMKSKSKLTRFTRRFAVIVAIGALWLIVAPVLSLLQLHDARDVIAAQQTVDATLCVEYICLSVSSAWSLIIVGAIAVVFAISVHRALSGRKQTEGTESDNADGHVRK